MRSGPPLLGGFEIGGGNGTEGLYASWSVILNALGHLCKNFGMSISVAGTGKRARFAAPEILVGVGFDGAFSTTRWEFGHFKCCFSSTLVPVFHRSNGNVAVAGARRGMERAALWHRRVIQGR